MDKGCKGCINHIDVGGKCNSSSFCTEDTYHAYSKKPKTKKEQLTYLKHQYDSVLCGIKEDKEKAIGIAMKIMKISHKEFSKLEAP